jgi:glycosyltransferase involved in cell wall biosynthesis
MTKYNSNKEGGRMKDLREAKSRITIVTPTYNRGELIRGTINSVLAQDYKDYVYIILDDGSSDDTREIVESMIDGKDNCFYVYHENMGEANTVNKGWSLCHSEYFLQVNSDDSIEPTLVSSMISALDNRRDCVVAYPDFYIINDSGSILEEVKNEDWNLVEALSLFSCYAAAPGAVIRKSAFPSKRKIKDDTYKYINDIKMLWEMALIGDFLHVSKTLASWMSHDQGISAYRYKSIPEVLDWAAEYFSKKNLPEEIKSIEAICLHSVYRYCLNLIIQSETDDLKVDFMKKYRDRYWTLVKEEDRYRSEIALLKDKIDTVQNREHKIIAAYENRRSWRITRPVRHMRALITNITDKR